MRSTRSINTSKPIQTKKTGFLLMFLAVFLAVLGLSMIYNVSSLSALTDFNDPYYYAKEQGRWLVLGIASMIFFSYFDYKRLFYLAVPALCGSILLLFAVFIQGIGIHAQGASRWLNLGFITVQPSELIKLSLILYLSAWFTHKERKRLTSFLVLLGLSVGPIILQPDLGSAAILIGIAISVYFLSGAPLWQFFALLPVAGATIGVIAVTASYRLDRIKTFLNPDLDPQGTSYHVRQILIALGSGGWFGLGLGKSRQKFAYLPEVTTDSIFAVIAEEIGFIGSTLILVLFVVLIGYGLRIASNARDPFGRLLGSGIVCALSLQMVVNLAGMVSLLPLTGVPLPFLSYGGSNLVISFTMVGILSNIAKHTS